MRLNSLHNALYVAAKLLRAELIAVKLIPASHVDWSVADIAVGDTSQLQQFGWRDGGTAPEPRACLRHHQPLFGVSNALSVYTKPDTNSLAIAVTVNETVLDALPGQFLLHERRGASKLQLGTVWFALCLESDSPSEDTLLDPAGASDLVELVFGVCSQALWSMYRSAMLELDSVTSLPGSAELRHRLQLNIATHRATSASSELHPADHACTLLMLLEIDSFSLLRRQLGVIQVDKLLKQLAAKLRGALRKNDGLFRFNDSVFAITADVAEGAASQVLDKINNAWRELAGEDHFAGITISMGYSLAGRTITNKSPNDSGMPSAQEFLLRVEQALTQAREAGGNLLVEANPELQLDLISQGQPTGGVFTSDPMKDYRNSRILWRTTSLIAGETNPGVLCRSFINLLQDMLSLRQADIFTTMDGVLRSQTQRPGSSQPREQSQLVQKCLNQRKTLKHESTGAQAAANDTPVLVAVPLISRTEAVGALLIETSGVVDDSDLVFLKAIADQIAGALDRLELAKRQEMLNARESASLRAEIRDLKDNVVASAESADAFPMVAVSQAMRDMLAYIDKIAPTDASVLIMGESGAGKEVMAKAIVAASKRADAPLITVDCSSIAHSLIDSELFGRVKGAFTGADDASPGRIAEAHGGTLFLDEIGELPMDVQGKLLRFVQEKELIAVGDTRRRRIDTRIICATNRDLLVESSQGRFRSDLYYRLQVLQVTVPPLRERRADIAALADTFAKRYSEQFGKSITGFTDAAWEKINLYRWPGNVRELQNAIVRATLTAETDLIDVADLQFGEELPRPEQSVFTSEQQYYPRPLDLNEQSQRVVPEAYDPGFDFGQSPAADASGQRQDAGDWTTLASLLAGQVAALVAESRLEAPVGRWLADTVVLTAAAVSDGVARQAARLLGVPETTLRRQLTKARQNEDNPFQLMSRQWLTSLPALTDLLESLMHQNEDDTEFAERCQVLLLQQVANHIGDDRKAGAALMGITPPTYARWLERYAIETQQVVRSAPTTTFKLEQKYS